MLITGGAPAFLRSALPSRGRGVASTGRPLWTPSVKVAGRYLGAYLARVLGEDEVEAVVDLEPSGSPALDQDEHEQAVQLLLSAADADARSDDFEGAIRWLAVVERLNLVIPSAYVTRRDEWRRRLDSGTPSDAAVRLDPSLDSAAMAISDLQRRIGWLREIDRRTEADMRAHLIGAGPRDGAAGRPFPARRAASAPGARAAVTSADHNEVRSAPPRVAVFGPSPLLTVTAESRAKRETRSTSMPVDRACGWPAWRRPLGPSRSFAASSGRGRGSAATAARGASGGAPNR